MARYVVGDIQGCYTQLQALLDSIGFSDNDELWAVGDLVNRGAESLEVLRFFLQLGARAKVVLGNHDMHLLAVAYGDNAHLKSKDTLDKILRASDRDELLSWLRQRPLLHHDAGVTMIHAGLPPQWELADAQNYAAEFADMLQSKKAHEFLREHMYGNKPHRWSKKLKGWERLRFIVNCFTRLRYCTADGELALKKKYAPENYDDSDVPWFAHSKRRSKNDRIVFGHWSTLGFYQGYNVTALDTGCLWGGELTALRLEDGDIFRLKCPGAQNPRDF
jgi:bis(5'-nucleosyl)-tetraphosphatase (symmetrical)